ncbi:sterol desaturase family protein [Desulfobacterota bacterium M19]
MDYNTRLRIIFFFGILILVAGYEFISPKRRLSVSKAGRWGNNLSIIFLNSFIVKLLFPITALSLAAAAARNNWGLFHYLNMPLWAEIIFAILLLDLIIYLQHLMFHATPLLWRLHMVHHADLDIDVTTGLRFHPIEIIISMLIKMAAVAALGPPVSAVLAFEIILNGTAMFNHGNISLPRFFDRFLRLLVVTPDMHRVHHSVSIRETNSNFGFSFPWWDRIFGTYRSQPALGHQGMSIGIAPFRAPEAVTLPRLLIMPFGRKMGRYSLRHIGADPRKMRPKGMTEVPR